MEQIRLNAYRIMWLFVSFDLPVVKKKDRKKAAKFRQFLLNNGYSMMQYSVYTRHCASQQKANMHIAMVEDNMPEKGHINIITITDKQYGNIINFWGAVEKPLEKAPQQLTFF